MAFAKNIDLPATIRTLYIAVILYQPKYRYLHHTGHIISFLNDHLHQILWRCYDHNAFKGKRLKSSQRYITSSWRHIYKKIIHISPDHICPELLHHIGKDRSSPDNRCFLCRKQQVNGHNLDPILCLHRINPLIVCLCSSLKTIHLRNRRSGNICIQDTYFISFLCHLIRQGSGNK